MIGDLIGTLWAPLGGLLAGLAAAGMAWLMGQRSERSRREAQDGKDYRNERQQIDREVSGIGGTDADRIRVLRDIARRRGEG